MTNRSPLHEYHEAHGARFVDFGGWDTHQDQGGVAGTFGTLAGQLATTLDAFARDLDDRMDDVLVVTLTDFGRTAAENGTGGTDRAPDIS